MSFRVKFFPTKEEVFEKSDEECRQLAETLRSTGKVFVDPEFPPNAASLGIRTHKSIKKPDTPWHAPHQFDKDWCVFNDPCPFEIEQGSLGNCWLIAALMCIARRKDILEHVLPRRDYNVDCGIVQVRLFIDGEWQVIKIDYHIPQIDGDERFVQSYFKEFWAAFIEKAFAKVKGSYGELDGGDAGWALECLTGNRCSSIEVNDKSPDDLWKTLTEADYLMAVSINELEENSYKKTELENLVLETEHVYSILDAKQHHGYQYILIGSTWTNDYKHKILPVYSKEDSCKFYTDDDNIESRAFWMKFQDFIRYFDDLDVCKYRKIFHQRCFSQTIKRTVNQDCQVLRLDTQQRQNFRIKITSEEDSSDHVTYMYLNIHRATSNNKCGELFKTVEDKGSSIEFLIKSITFDPGSYFLVFIGTQHSDNEYALDWSFESSTTLENVSISFVNFPCTLLVESLQATVMKYGERKEIRNDKKQQIVVYIWTGFWSSIAIVENTSNSDYIRVQ
ncbi:hypothetical protein CRE_16029 [Caenorhabditis remanei]|uniref:Calpain catalytic domain-containing protein n=1 Tax=Caenorhabditis remanei TaxID=31234 RepID=E3MBF3_CAERE|nr:hypothetical protein CRE_16029 [Caenorhabditis remanei]